MTREEVIAALYIAGSCVHLNEIPHDNIGQWFWIVPMVEPILINTEIANLSYLLMSTAIEKVVEL